MTTDQDLLDRVRAGDRVAFGQLFARYHRDCLLYTSIHPKGVDLVSEVWLQVWHSPPKIHGRTVRPWLRAQLHAALIHVGAAVDPGATTISTDSDGDGTLAIAEAIRALERARLEGRVSARDYAAIRSTTTPPPEPVHISLPRRAVAWVRRWGP